MASKRKLQVEPPLGYAIVVPSRKRVHNMPVIRELLPDAVICIDEREHADYQDAVPPGRLLLHPPMDTAARVRNWIMDEVTTPILVHIDDDFAGVQVLTGSQRYITNAEEIRAILDNAARACADLGLTTFCFSGTPNATIVRPDVRPIMATQPVFRVFGTMGAARTRKFRTDIPGRADLDWTLRTLLLDRCVYADVRFYFDCGPVFTGRGGAVGLITPEQFTAGTRELRKTWGRHVSFKVPGWQKKQNQVASVSLKVVRANKTAQR